MPPSMSKAVRFKKEEGRSFFGNFNMLKRELADA